MNHLQEYMTYNNNKKFYTKKIICFLTSRSINTFQSTLHRGNYIRIHFLSTIILNSSSKSQVLQNLNDELLNKITVINCITVLWFKVKKKVIKKKFDKNSLMKYKNQHLMCIYNAKYVKHVKVIGWSWNFLYNIMTYKK